MTFGEHLDELRVVLFRSLVGLVHRLRHRLVHRQVRGALDQYAA